MQCTREVEQMTCVAKGPNHGPAPIPEEGRWVPVTQISDISGFTHGIGWCARTPPRWQPKSSPEKRSSKR